MAGNVYLAYDYPILGAFWTVFLVGLAVLWFFLLFRVITDIFRDSGMNGWVKTGWLLFVILLPFLGIFVYIVARGHGMGERELREAQKRREAFDSYVRETAHGDDRPARSHAAELAELTAMHDKGALSDEEFQRAKAKVLH
ncbi:SHOCT domain-containing protein [Streptomyces sp. NPDC057539]|uniref:SHOCT domain-containing protein n=1 Tax=Streptomyces sp. NPDC057539 TaxID=3346159 RepID=UPI00368FB49C